MKSVNTQIEEVDRMLSMYREVLTTEREKFTKNLENIGISIEFAEALLFDKEPDIIKIWNIDDISGLFKAFECNFDIIKEEYYHSKDKTISFHEFAIDILLKVREKMSNIVDAEENIKVLEDERLDISRSFTAALKSPEYREARIAQIQKLREHLDEEEDPKRRKELSDKLDQIEISQNFTFLNERLHSIGKKEVQSIISGFFEMTKGTYTMKRYYTNLKRMEISPEIHRMFFSLEEKFLPESYHVYNDLFLYHVIRWVSYMDVDDAKDYLYMSSIIGALKDLITADATDEEKQTLLGVMKDFYSFIDNEERYKYFEEKNISYKNHPERILAEKHAEEQRKLKIQETFKRELGQLYEKIYVIPPSDFESELAKIQEEKVHMIEQLENLKVSLGGRKRYEDIFNLYERTMATEALKEEDSEAVGDSNKEESTEVPVVESTDESTEV